MKIYKTYEIKNINLWTKEITTKKRSVLCHICDYSGLVIDEYDKTWSNYIIDYGNNDPLFGSYCEDEEFLSQHIDMYSFMNQPYEYYDDSLGSCLFGNQEEKMLNKIVSIKHLEDFNGLDEIMRFFRVKVAKKLISQGVIDPEDLIS